MSPGGRLRARLASGQFAVTAEIGPPRGADPAAIRRKAEPLRGWVDAVNITDNAGAHVRMASWAGCLLAAEAGIEPVMQVTCRDRNRLALQSDLLAAGAMGIPNVLLMTGDHPRFGDHPDATPVFDLDGMQLVEAARGMRDEGVLLSGRRLSVRPDWLIGAAENPFAPPADQRAAILGRRADAGAEFVQTQFVFDVARVRPLDGAGARPWGGPAPPRSRRRRPGPVAAGAQPPARPARRAHSRGGGAPAERGTGRPGRRGGAGPVRGDHRSGT